MKKPPIENKIYASIIGKCEELEFKGAYRGNGHHLAQKLTVMISAGILPKQQRKIYEALTTTPQTTREISRKIKLSTKQVSAQLINIHSNTLLISFKLKNKKNKLWYKYE